MNKLLTNMANNSKLQKAVIFSGLSISALGSAIMYIGVYYFALRKGVELRDEYYEQETMEEKDV